MIASIFLPPKKRGKVGLGWNLHVLFPDSHAPESWWAWGLAKLRGTVPYLFFIQNNLFCVAKIEISTKVTLHNCYDYWKWKTQSVVDWFNIWQARIKGVFPNSYALVGWLIGDVSTVINVNRIILDYRVMTIWGIQNYWQLMLMVMVTMMQIRTVVTLVLASHAKTPQEQGGFLGDESPLSVWVETFWWRILFI